MKINEQSSSMFPCPWHNIIEIVNSELFCAKITWPLVISYFFLIFVFIFGPDMSFHKTIDPLIIVKVEFLFLNSRTFVKRPYETRHTVAFQTRGCLLLHESNTESSCL